MAKHIAILTEAARKRGEQRRTGARRQQTGNIVHWRQAPDRLAAQSVPCPGEDGEPESTSATFQLWALVIIATWAIAMVGLRFWGVL